MQVTTDKTLRVWPFSKAKTSDGNSSLRRVMTCNQLTRHDFGRRFLLHKLHRAGARCALDGP